MNSLGSLICDNNDESVVVVVVVVVVIIIMLFVQDYEHGCRTSWCMKILLSYSGCM